MLETRMTPPQASPMSPSSGVNPETVVPASQLPVSVMP